MPFLSRTFKPESTNFLSILEVVVLILRFILSGYKLEVKLPTGIRLPPDSFCSFAINKNPFFFNGARVLKSDLYFASVTKNGRDIKPEDVHTGKEPYLVAGDTVRAIYAFENNIHGYWSSIKSEDILKHDTTRESLPPDNPGRWGYDIYGSRGIVSYR